MPASTRHQSSSGSSEDSSSQFRFSEDSEYPALSFADYSEKPISEQLEPIAVVGMGMLESYCFDNLL
jgi:hypothetical protein